MRRSFVALTIALTTTSWGLVDAFAEAPPRAAHGALVIALGDNVTPGAKALAREVYRDEHLRPQVDEGTVRVLAGEPIADDAPPSLQSLARIRQSLPVAPDELGAKLIAAIGQERHVEIVVAVSMTGERPTARVVRVASAKYESVVLEGTTGKSEGDVVRYAWPGATNVLLQLYGPTPRVSSPGPITPRKIDPAAPTVPSKGTSWYKSPWFWGPLGAVVATGAAIVIATQVTKDDVSSVRLRGQVGP
jgi:hypothetical protein